MKAISKKESEVFTYVVEGFTNDEIASKLNITTKTVKFHITSIFKKTQTTSRSKLIVGFYKSKLDQIQITNSIFLTTKKVE